MESLVIFQLTELASKGRVPAMYGIMECHGNDMEFKIGQGSLGIVMEFFMGYGNFHCQRRNFFPYRFRAHKMWQAKSCTWGLHKQDRHDLGVGVYAYIGRRTPKRGLPTGRGWRPSNFFLPRALVQIVTALRVNATVTNYLVSAWCICKCQLATSKFC